jgi:hypothetical protein
MTHEGLAPENQSQTFVAGDLSATACFAGFHVAISSGRGLPISRIQMKMERKVSHGNE